MKTINTLLFSLFVALTSSAIFAQPMSRVGNYTSKIMTRTIHVEPTDSKQRAYEIALSTLKSLETLSANKLNSALNIIDSKANKTHIEEGSFVTVQERKTGNGKMEYVGLVNVRAHYLAHDNNN